MTLTEFKALGSVDHLAPLLQALWHDHHGRWDQAHQLAQDVNSPEGWWVHAYLHRKEGDLSNASYWYHRAGRKTPSLSLAAEWEEIVKTLMG